MKKIISILMTAVLLFSLCTVVMADDFMGSPSAKPGPEVVEIEGDDELEGTVIVTPFKDKNNLDPENKAAIEKIYDDIKGNTDNTAFSQALDKISAGQNVDRADLAVSELFNVTVKDGTEADAQGKVTIKLKLEDAGKFVSLVVFNGEKWEVVEGATVNGDILTFKAAPDGQFAVVVDASAATNNNNDPTGDIIMTLAVVMAVSAAGIVVTLVLGKKKQSAAK